MPLNKAQKEAVEYLNGPLLVLAGPGTGKTQLLSSKVAYILKETDANPENILCITFTEAGARNMRERLLSIIGPDAHKIPIHTYHAFGADLLAKYRNYSATFTRTLDEAISPVMQYKIINDIQDHLPVRDILKGDRINDIISTISSAKTARLTPDDLEAIGNNNLADTAEINQAATVILQNLVPRMKYSDAMDLVYTPLMELFAEHISDKPIVGQIEKEANALVLSLKEAIDKSTQKEKPSVSPLTTWKTATFELGPDGNYRLKNLIANKKLLSLANIYRKYQTYLEENSLYDFDDMIEEAIKTLKNDKGFQLTLSEQYQYILLDEFQDTNPSQFELIQLLTDYDHPIIMAVGDDDQAIFAFQGANASNLLDFQNHYNAKVITLTENYRSTADILNTSHLIARQIEDSFAKKHSINKILHANITPSAAEISRHEFLSSDGEYYWVSEQIHNLIKNGESQKDIAIIAPKHKFILALLPYLKKYPDINIAYEKRENILEDQKIHELIVLSKYIYDLSSGTNSKHHLAEILSFPFWKLSPTKVLSLGNTPLVEAKEPEFQAIGNFLNELTTQAFNAPLELFLDYLIGAQPLNGYTSPFEKFYAENTTDYSTFELYNNLNVLREAIRAHTKAQNPKLKDFITMLEDYKAADATLTNTSPYQDSENSVQLLSAHKSKGLEFKHVFIISTDNVAWGKGKGNNNFLVLPKNLVQIRHTGTTDSELLRLFFVAITRAKEKLILTNSIKNFTGKTVDRLSYLNEHQDENNHLVSPFLPDTKIITHYEDLEEAKKATDLRTSWATSYFKLTPELLPILKKRMENYKVTATDLTSFIDVQNSGPMDFYKNKILRIPPEPANFNLNYGNLVHATFEKVTKENLDDSAAIAFYKTAAETLPLTNHEIAELIEKGAYSLEIALQKFHDILHAQKAGAEVDLRHEHLSINGIPITGKIDHININETDKTIEIYDFKTGKFQASKWDSHATLFKYKLQLGFYKLLLENSPTYQKYKVTRAHILFVTPDEDNQIHDKPYDYTDADESLLKDLIAAVYQQVRSLDFLSSPDLALEPDHSKGLKEIKNFINLILDITT